MNTDTQQFNQASQTSVFDAAEPPRPHQEPKAGGTSRVTIVALVVAGLALALAAGAIILLARGEMGNVAEATPSPVVVVTSTPTPEPEPAVNTNQVTAPPAGSTQAPPPPPANPPAPNPDPDPDPDPDPLDPGPDPFTEIHPLEGTLWDVMVMSDGAGSMYDIHPDHPHQVEFRDGTVYSRGLNSGSTHYSISGDEWGWGPEFSCGTFVSTMMGGPVEAMNQDLWVDTALQNAAYYEIFEHTLYIRDAGANTLLILDLVPGC